MPQCKERGKMLGNYVTVDGVSSRTLGLFCKQLPMWPIATESKDTVTVGGRLSNLYKSAKHYNDISVDIEAVLLGRDTDAVVRYFTAGKKLVFSHIPDRYGIIRQLVAIDQNRVGNGALELKISLKCDPFKYGTSQTLEFLTSPQGFSAGGNTSAEPLIVAKGCSDGFEMSLTGVSFSTSGLTGDIYIDVPNRVTYQISGLNEKIIVDDHTTGNIWDLLLNPGAVSSIAFAGATSIQITPNERWL